VGEKFQGISEVSPACLAPTGFSIYFVGVRQLVANEERNYYWHGVLFYVLQTV
jgi:hypothetical protein